MADIDPKSFGATGRFPQGQINPTDEGELQLGIAVDHEKKVVILNFGKAIVWFGADADTVLKLAEKLREKALELKSRE